MHCQHVWYPAARRVPGDAYLTSGYETFIVLCRSARKAPDIQ